MISLSIIGDSTERDAAFHSNLSRTFSLGVLQVRSPGHAGGRRPLVLAQSARAAVSSHKSFLRTGPLEPGSSTKNCSVAPSPHRVSCYPGTLRRRPDRPFSVSVQPHGWKSHTRGGSGHTCRARCLGSHPGCSTWSSTTTERLRIPAWHRLEAVSPSTAQGWRSFTGLGDRQDNFKGRSVWMGA